MYGSMGGVKKIYESVITYEKDTVEMGSRVDVEINRQGSVKVCLKSCQKCQKYIFNMKTRKKAVALTIEKLLVRQPH